MLSPWAGSVLSLLSVYRAEGVPCTRASQRAAEGTHKFGSTCFAHCGLGLASVESLEHHLRIIRSSLNAFTEMPGACTRIFTAAAFTPNNGNVSAHQQLLPSFPLEQVFLVT